MGVTKRKQFTRPIKIEVLRSRRSDTDDPDLEYINFMESETLPSALLHIFTLLLYE